MKPKHKKFAGTRVRIGEARDRDVEVFDVKGREEEHDHAGDHVEVDHAGDIAVDPVATRDELEATLEEREQAERTQQVLAGTDADAAVADDRFFEAEALRAEFRRQQAEAAVAAAARVVTQESFDRVREH